MYLEHTPVPFFVYVAFLVPLSSCPQFLGPHGTEGRKNRADLSSQSLNANLPALYCQPHKEQHHEHLEQNRECRLS